MIRVDRPSRQRLRGTWMRLFTALILAALPLLAVSAFSARAEQTLQHVSYLPLTIRFSVGRIAFMSERDGNYEIYVMNADGSSQTRLTTNPADDMSPVWSPDGRQIAFASERDGNYEIYVMNADGSSQTRLTTNLEYDAGPVWSPDGRQIAFTSQRDGNLEIYVMNADGSSQTRLTRSGGADTSPTWSPDGRQIAFASSRGANTEINTINADGSNLTNLTNNLDVDMEPAWSPDGQRIAFASSRDKNGYDIYLMNADGSDQTRLTNMPTNDTSPSWSPDGHLIAFYSSHDVYASAESLSEMGIVRNTCPSRNPLFSCSAAAASQPSTRTDLIWSHFVPLSRPLLIASEISVINADGSNLTTLISMIKVEGDEYGPVWSPDGRQIAFHSFETIENCDIYVINADGSSPTRLTISPRYDMRPAWSPR